MVAVQDEEVAVSLGSLFQALWRAEKHVVSPTDCQRCHDGNRFYPTAELQTFAPEEWSVMSLRALA